MTNGITELVFILDRSGSMSGLEADTIGGFNAMIEKQKKEPGEAYVSTVLFDNVSEVLHDRVKLVDVPKMTDRDYTVRGCTALIDAIGGAIRHVANIHKYAREDDVPEKTMFIITTDGMENASQSWRSCSAGHCPCTGLPGTSCRAEESLCRISCRKDPTHRSGGKGCPPGDP